MTMAVCREMRSLILNGKHSESGFSSAQVVLLPSKLPKCRYFSYPSPCPGCASQDRIDISHCETKILAWK